MKDIVMVECKKHSARIPERTCFLRFGEIKYYTGKNLHKFNGCKGCKKGSEIYERLLNQKESPVIKKKYGDKKCTVCKKSMGISMFGNKGKNDICIECEEIAQDKETEKKTKTCSCCSKTFPVDLFYNNKSKKDQLSDWCKECTKQKNKHYKTYQQTGKVEKKKPEIKKEEKSDNFILVIDFSLHKDLFERLKKKAENEFRTVEQQILFNCNALTK